MRNQRVVVLIALLAIMSTAVSCLPLKFDRPATVEIDYVDGACEVTAYNSVGDEIDPLQLWPERVVYWKNRTDCKVVVTFPSGDYFGSKSVTLPSGATTWRRVKKKAPHVDFYYTVECCVTAGATGGSAGPKASVGDDTGDP